VKILVIGEINPDLILQGYHSFPELGKEILVDDLRLTLGSASAICAAGLAKLGEQVSFFGKVGADTYGEFCVDYMRKAGINMQLVQPDPALKTGITVSISGPKDRAMVTYLGAMLALTEADVPDTLFDGFDHVQISAYYLQEGLRPGCASIFERASRRGLTTSLDTGFDPSETWGPDIHETLRHVDIFLPNELELRHIGGSEDEVEALKRLQNGRTQTVAKLGGRGAITLVDGQPLHVPAFKVTPVDTTGAGDSFNAGFLHAWLNWKQLPEAMKFAAACGALSTQGLGGTGCQATEAEALAFIREQEQAQ
jgi:sugar/nucleoside kinase (ribokinase family)